MKRLRNCGLALLLGCCTPLLIWVGAGSALYQSRKQILKNIACAIDADCPPGFVCAGGSCVPAK